MAKKSSASGGSDKVKLETKARIKSIPWTKRSTDFPVLVRVTAPRRCTQTQRPGVDLVAVLDISGSMGFGTNRLESMIQAMLFVIDNLGHDDRLSVVSFNSQVQRRTELSVMSDENRAVARTKVNNLIAGGGNDMGAAMQEAAKILRQRAPEESSSRIGRIMFLSDGEDNVVFSQHISPEFPAETFGLGADHDPKVMHYIAEKTLGVYSYINQDIEKIKDAFAQSIGGLTSVTAMGVQIKLQTHKGVSISSIDSGGYPQRISSDKQTGTIEINDLYAGEKKNLVVFLTVPEGKEKLITVNGSYQNPKISKEASIQLGESEVTVVRPKASTPSDEAVDPDVAAELARLRLVKGVSAMAEAEHLNKDMLQSLWDKIRDSEDGPKASEATMSDLGNDVAGMQREGKPFMLSWLTSHLWQRATTKGSPSESGAFRTTAMKKMIDKVDNIESESEPESESGSDSEPESKGKLKIMWEKVIAWATSNPYSCALPCAAVLLLAALLLMLYVGTRSPDSPHVKPVRDNRGSNPLDVSHPGWPKMEKALEVTMLRSMEDVGITSFLHGASVEDMRHATNRYLYLAIVHASVLGSRCRSEDVGTISLLEQKVERLEAEKKDLLVKGETLAKEKEEMAVSAANCAAGKDNEEALERANTRIAELERQLHDKKAFADNLLSEVANADAHLKTCGQRVDMLEAKIREIEGVVVSH